MSDLREHGFSASGAAWEVRTAGRLAGFVVLARLSRERWQASPVLLEEGAAPALAQVIEREGAWEVAGGAAHVDPLVGHLARGRPATRQSFFGSDAPSDRPADPRTRTADQSDLTTLVELYRSYELETLPTVRQLRAYLERSLARRPIIVLEIDGRVVAAARCEARGERFDLWSHVTVLPEHRGAGLYRALHSGIEAESARAGRLVCGAPSPSNPARHGRGDVAPWTREWVTVRLQPNLSPLRLLARRTVRVAEGRLHRRPLPARTTGSPGP